MAVARGCGTRIAGGLYLETLLGPTGHPVESFLMDPVKPLNMTVAAIGVSFVEHPDTGVVNVVDWVSGTDYPNVADLVEEVRRFGLSRRISTTAPIGRLTADSKILLVHGRAYVGNHTEYEPLRDCPTRRHQPLEILLPPGSHCCALWWDDVTGGEPSGLPEGAPDEAVERVAKLAPSERSFLASAYEASGQDISTRDVTRTMPSFRYRARSRPPNISPAYQPAIFAAFPIHQLTVITDPIGRTHEATLRAAEKAGMFLPIRQEDE